MKKSREIRDTFDIPMSHNPLAERKAAMCGVPARSRVAELLEISEAIRQKQGPYASLRA